MAKATATPTPASEVLTIMNPERLAAINAWRARTKGKGILELDADSLLGIYCQDNSLTIAVGATGIPNDATFMAFILPGETPDFDAEPHARMRVLFSADSIPEHEVRYYCPTFDITD